MYMYLVAHSRKRNTWCWRWCRSLVWGRRDGSEQQTNLPIWKEFFFIPHSQFDSFLLHFPILLSLSSSAGCSFASAFPSVYQVNVLEEAKHPAKPLTVTVKAKALKAFWMTFHPTLLSLPYWYIVFTHSLHQLVFPRIVPHQRPCDAISHSPLHSFHIWWCYSGIYKYIWMYMYVKTTRV